MENLLARIDDYTTPTVENMTDATSALFKAMDKLEKIYRTFPDQKMKTSLMSNLDRSRVFMLDNIDMFNERMDEI